MTRTFAAPSAGRKAHPAAAGGDCELESRRPLIAGAAADRRFARIAVRCASFQCLIACAADRKAHVIISRTDRYIAATAVTEGSGDLTEFSTGALAIEERGRAGLRDCFAVQAHSKSSVGFAGVVVPGHGCNGSPIARLLSRTGGPDHGMCASGTANASQWRTSTAQIRGACSLAFCTVRENRPDTGREDEHDDAREDENR